MRYQTVFRQYDLRKPHHYGLLLKSLINTNFPYTYLSVPYATKPQVGDGKHYLKPTIDYTKHLVHDMAP